MRSLPGRHGAAGGSLVSPVRRAFSGSGAGAGATGRDRSGHERRVHLRSRTHRLQRHPVRSGALGGILGSQLRFESVGQLADSPVDGGIEWRSGGLKTTAISAMDKKKPAIPENSSPNPAAPCLTVPVPPGPIPAPPPAAPRTQVAVTIDGKAVRVPEGSTLLEACRRLGIDTPTLCYLENLNPVNVCRVCVVELEGSRTLVPACSRPVEKGWWSEPTVSASV